MVVPPRTPTCRIRGTIRRVDFEEGHAPDDDAFGPPGSVPGVGSPAQYRLTIILQHVSYVTGDDEEETCEERYVPGSEDVVFLYQDALKPGDAFREGQVIEGEVWNGYLRSYALERPG